MNLLSDFQKLRKEAGLTQSRLAYESGVSLPMLQLIEAGKTNPSIAVIEKIAAVLGFEVLLKRKPFDFHDLIPYGLPLGATHSYSNRRVSGSIQDLVRGLKAACVSLLENPSGFSREKRATQAMLLALFHHYPDFFKKHFSKNEKLLLLLPKKLDGELLKLRRIALSGLSEFL